MHCRRLITHPLNEVIAIDVQHYQLCQRCDDCCDGPDCENWLSSYQVNGIAIDRSELAFDPEQGTPAPLSGDRWGMHKGDSCCHDLIRADPLSPLALPGNDMIKDEVAVA